MTDIIDNDFHPSDQGLEASDDHWGTVTPVTNAVKDVAKNNKKYGREDDSEFTRSMKDLRDLNRKQK